MALRADVVMPVVPMAHANAWGIPYSAAMRGASQFSRAVPRSDSLLELIQQAAG